jgi:hypothetical protein
MKADKFYPLLPLGPPWTHEKEMYLHSAIVMALETMGWHPCPAINAGWVALGTIASEFKLTVEPMADDQRDQYVAKEIKAGHCPFGNLKPGQQIPHCPLGFPGCSCGDELMLNPYLKELEPL